ncbi:hypothetical protein AVS7_00135 [Acidovorax sp. MR-S7]|nr:hypothetical protein AVS7_00135 [Acidovorax sp. MR-S7]
MQLRKAQRALNSKVFNPRDVSELAGAIGGAELWNGKFKEARKLFRLALEHPNDNVLAQAITNQEFLGIEVDEALLRRAPNGVFEGRALRALMQTDFEAASELTECWSEEEPFSSRPRTLQSFVCGALGTFEKALGAADKGLTADASDLSLRGNRAYALAALGRLDEAESELSVINAQADDNARFSAMCSHYLFDPDFCNVASGWEKGVVEKNVQDSRRRIWIEAASRRFGSFAELNAWLGERCRSVWADTVHPIHKQFTVAEMLELERPHLMSMPVLFDGYVEKPARVSSTCLVAVARNRYSVPCEWAGHLVSTRLYPNRVDIACAQTIIASHARTPGSGQVTYDWQH